MKYPMTRDELMALPEAPQGTSVERIPFVDGSVMAVFSKDWSAATYFVEVNGQPMKVTKSPPVGLPGSPAREQK